MAGCMFQVAKRFLFLFCASKGVEKQFLLDLDGTLQKTVESIEEDWEGEKELDAIANLFCRAVQNATEWLPGIVNLNAVDSERWDSIADMVWYDEKYYYLSERMFSDICNSIKSCTSSRRMKLYMGEHEKAASECYQVSWNRVETTRLDTARLKAELPEIYKRFSSTSASRRFMVKETAA